MKLTDKQYIDSSLRIIATAALVTTLEEQWSKVAVAMHDNAKTMNMLIHLAKSPMPIQWNHEVDLRICHTIRQHAGHAGHT